MERSHSSRRESSSNTVEICDCGEEIKYAISRSVANPGRKYKGCPNYKKPGKKWCKTFDWLDEVKEDGWLDEMKEAGSNEEARMVIFLLKVVCVLLMIIILVLLVAVALLDKKYQLMFLS